MGKKGKKGKKAPDVTPQEGLLAYQINVVEKKLEDVRYEIRGWEEKNKRHLERNEKLKAEQKLLWKNLLENARVVAKVFVNEEIITHKEVIATMKEKWSRERRREKELQDLKSQIAQKMVEIEEKQQEVNIWLTYRDAGRHVHDTEIRILEQELRDLQTSYDDISTHLEQTFLASKTEVEKYTDHTLALQKDKASDKAMAHLDKKDRQEVLDNDWLKKEVQIHRLETAKVRERVEDLERTNLEMMSHLFDCTVEDLKISRNFFLTQCENAENLESAGILEMDLCRLLPPDADHDSVKGRPPSATLKAVQDKVLSITSHCEEQSAESQDKSETTDEPFPSLMLEEEDFEDYLHLGPVELKLLSIAGTQATLHKPERLSSTQLAAKDYNPDVWPITQPMLKKALLPCPK